MERLHAIIYGRVQGVSFRYYMTRRAEELGIKGWVRNRPDGAVETMAEGERAALDEFLEFLNQGPSGAQVNQVEVKWLNATNLFKRFEIKL